MWTPQRPDQAAHHGRTLARVLAVVLIGWPLPARAGGDLKVTQVGAHLRITGDAQANMLSLVDAGDITVGSFDPAGTVNGGPGVFVAHGVEKIVVDLRGGDDSVTLVDLFFGGVPGELRIVTGSGNDTINAEDSSVRTLRVTTAAGDDTVLWDGGRCGSLVVRTGAGDDEIWLSGFHVDGKALVETGTGADLVSSFVQTFRGAVTLTTGAGDDTLALTSSTFDGVARFNGGRGADDFDAGQSTFNGPLAVRNFERHTPPRTRAR